MSNNTSWEDEIAFKWKPSDQQYFVTLSGSNSGPEMLAKTQAF